MNFDFLCVAKDEEVTHIGGNHPDTPKDQNGIGKGSDKREKTEYTLTFIAAKGGAAIGSFQLPLLSADAAAAYEVGKIYEVTVAPK